MRSYFKNSSPRKIFIINFGGIGDNLMCSPAIRALNLQFPHATITVMTGSKVSVNAYINNSRIRKVLWLQQFDAGSVKYAFATKNRLFFDLFRLFICYPTLAIKLLFFKFDIGINFSAFEGGANFGNLLMYLCGIPIRVGGFGFYIELLTHKKASGELKDKHWVDIYLSIIESLGIKSENKDLEFFVLKSDQDFIEKFLMGRSILNSDFLIGLIPGATTYVNNKRWPKEKFTDVINRLTKKYTFKVFIFGTSNEKDLITYIHNMLEIESFPIIGLELNKVAALLKKMNIILTNDNGILHLADAVGVKYIISIFGPTDPKRIVSRNERNIYISSKLQCAPCIELDAADELKRCFKTNKGECIESISTEEVYKVIEIIFEKQYKSSINL